MESIERHVLDYVNMLRNQRGLYVTLHGKMPYVFTRMNISCGMLSEYNIHYNPYCFCIKQSGAINKACIKHQRKLGPKLNSEGEFFGMCHAGVCEFVYPVSCFDEIIGFVCVSGYRPREDDALYEKAMRRIGRLSKEYGMDIVKQTENYSALLTPEIPEKSMLDTLIRPLCDMLSLMIMKRMGMVQLPHMTENDGASDRLYLRICQYLWGKLHGKNRYRKAVRRIQLQPLIHKPSVQKPKRPYR